MKAQLNQVEVVEFFGSEIEDGGKWGMICNLHHEMFQDTNKRRLMTFKKHSEIWCMGCQDDSNFCYTCEISVPDFYFVDGVWTSHVGHVFGKGNN
jgi:hypothetical protein